MNTVEVVFSPPLYESKLTKSDFIVVIADILRATTSICAALGHGVKSVIPVSGVDAARDYKQKGFLVACERDGKVLDFADTGNSPSDFIKEEYRGKEIVFSTTNGTRAANMAGDAEQIVAGSFLNLTVLGQWLSLQDKNVVIFCSAWKNLFNLEDSVFAGALTDLLLKTGRFTTECDSAKASVDLWSIAGKDLKNYLSKSSHRNRLRHLVSDEDFIFTLTPDSSPSIPLLKNGRFENILKEE